MAAASGFRGNAFELIDRTKDLGNKVWLLKFDLPGEKVNKFSREVMEEFEKLVTTLEGMSGQIEALIVVSPKPGIFIAGADIKMIQAAKTEDEATKLSAMGQALLNRWEDLPFATIVAINGAALGGGCEFSLASSAIAMSSDKSAKIGLPEVMLGVIPGMGGCVRLPAKVGIANALDMILASKQLDGERAFKSGLADVMIPKENFQTEVEQWVVKNLKSLLKRQRLGREPKLGGAGGAVGKILEGTPFGRAVIYSKARDGVMKQTKGKYPAALEAVRVLKANGVTYGKPLRGKARERAMDREAKGFGKCAATDVSKNLIRIFFMTEDVKKSNGLPSGTSTKPIKVRVGGVLGAGIMGGGIAQLFADRGIQARMKDITTQALATGVDSAARIFKKKVERRRMTKREYAQKMNLIAPTLDFTGFEATDLVVEAVVEKMEIKKTVLKELEGHVRADAVIATNTSSLSVSEMQTALSKPERFVGMHFFNPVHRMPLVEVIRGQKSNDQAIASTYQLCKDLGKTPIVVKDAPGFLVNRLLLPYLNEAAFILGEGVPMEEIDRALEDFGMPMGPIELLDEVGLDTAEKVAHVLEDAFKDRVQANPQSGALVKGGRLGKKNGKGFYTYEGKGGRRGTVDNEVYSLLGVKTKPGSMKAQDIVERCVFTMINEASLCLEEKVADKAADVDLGMIMGTGFPPFRGGLLRYADSVGAKYIIDRLKSWEAEKGLRFKQAAPLVRMAERGEKFHKD